MTDEMIAIRNRLAAYFYADEVEWKIQSTSKDKTRGMMVAYIQSRAIMNRLDSVMGINGWRDEYAAGPGGGVVCGLSLRFGGDWITKWDGADNTNIEAVKGGLTDAFKRAAVKWGIGRYLYSLPGYWVDLDERGKAAEEPQIPRVFMPDDADRHGNRPSTSQPVQQVAKGNGKPAPANPLKAAADPPLMSLETAKNFKNNGVLYGEYSSDDLNKLAAAIDERLKDTKYNQKEREDFAMRRDAITVILADRMGK